MPDPNDTNNKPPDEDAPEATPAEDTLPPGPDESAIVEQPSADELAAELNKVEEAVAADETATEPQAAQTPADEPPAPDQSPDPEPASSDSDAPSDGTDPPDDGTDPTDSGTDPADSETESPPGRTIAPPLKSQAGGKSQAEKKAADATRRKDKIDAAEKLMIPLSEADEAEQARKDAIREEMADVTEEREEALAHASKCQDLLRELSERLYPHATKSDHIVKAVKGYTESQKRLRAHRATEPARLKALLEQAGKSPIDAAFMRQRARGARRPVRSQIRPPAAKNGDGDQGGGSDANAGKE